MAHIHQAKRRVERGGRKGEGKGEERGIAAGTENVFCNRAVTQHLQHQMFPLIITCSLDCLKGPEQCMFSISILIKVSGVLHENHYILLKSNQVWFFHIRESFF